MIRPAMRLWHLYVFTSTSFFNSPRGRWAMHILCEVCVRPPARPRAC